MTGTVLVSYSEGFEAGNRIVGAIILPLLAATGSAIYKVCNPQGDGINFCQKLLPVCILVSCWIPK